MSSQLGFRRQIKRYDGTSHWQTEELLCPCCGRLTRVEFNQTDAQGNVFAMTHCLNQCCTGYYMTRFVDAFFECYGKKEIE